MLSTYSISHSSAPVPAESAAIDHVLFFVFVFLVVQVNNTEAFAMDLLRAGEFETVAWKDIKVGM